MALQFRGALQKVGPIVKLSIQSHHAAIGFIQFAIELGQLLLARPEFLQGIEQFLVLLLEFFVRILRGAFDAGEYFIEFAGFEALEAAGGFLSEEYGSSPARIGFNLERVPQAVVAKHAQTHASLRNVFAAHNLIEMRDAPAFIAK